MELSPDAWHADTGSNADTCADSHAGANCDRDTQPDANGDAYPNANGHTDADTFSYAVADADPECAAAGPGAAWTARRRGLP